MIGLKSRYGKKLKSWKNATLNSSLWSRRHLVNTMDNQTVQKQPQKLKKQLIICLYAFVQEISVFSVLSVILVIISFCSVISVAIPVISF